MSSDILKLKAFSKTYGNQCILSFPERTLQPGTTYALLGANGCGKSTFARILSGLLESDQKESPFFAAPSSIGFLPQKPYVFHLSVEKNLMLNAGTHKKNSRIRASELLNAFHLTDFSKKNAASLSGGEASRMCLARLLMQEYSLLILDEPCASMDIASTLQTETLLLQYQKETNASIILITHSLSQAKRLADEVLFLHNGILWEDQAASAFFSTPEKKETREFLNFYL